MILPFTANALSATTAQVINGTAPYLTFNGGTTKATTTAELLGITLSDGTAYTQTNSSAPGNEIILPVAGQSMANVGMLVPATASPVSGTDPTQKVTLSTLVSTNGYWGDDDGDGQGAGGVTATGDLSVVITDASGNKVKRSDPLTACTAYYKVVLTSTAGNLTTQYGKPNETSFTGDSATYYIKPKIVAPYTCNAKPNLTNEGGVYASSQWEVGKGFKLQSLGNPASNFPTTGSHGLSFELTIAGATAQSVITTMGTTVQGNPSTTVSLALSASSANVLKVTLQGPKNDTAAGQIGFTPTTFSLKSGTTEIYNFSIGKWFIARPGGINYYDTQTYCGTTLPGYRVPLRSEYTNAGNVTQPAYDPVTGTHNGDATSPNNNYTRTIGGGLFAEWGYTANDQTPYSSSDWNNFYWTPEAFSSGRQYFVYSSTGFVNSHGAINAGNRAACVMP